MDRGQGDLTYIKNIKTVAVVFQGCYFTTVTASISIKKPTFSLSLSTYKKNKYEKSNEKSDFLRGRTVFILKRHQYDVKINNNYLIIKTLWKKEKNQTD